MPWWPYDLAPAFRQAELNANVALMGVALARSNHLHLGSAFAVDGAHLRLIGLYTTGSSFGDNSIALPMGTAERIPFYDSKSIWVALYAPTAEAVPSLARTLRHRLGPAVSVTTHQSGISGALTALLGLEKSSTSSLLLALGAAVIITMATVVLTIRGRISEIGLLKAIGASDLQVVQQFAMENVICSLMAAAAGALLLTVAGRAIARAFEVTAVAGGQSQISVGLTPRTALALAGVGMGLARTMNRHAATQFRRRMVGFVFQSFHLIPNLSALENVALPMALAGVPGRTRNKRARDLLDQVEIGTAWHLHRPRTLSGGQQQRIAVARALANDPPVLLADEPTGNFDTRTGLRIIELLKRSADTGRTVVLVTHNEHLAEMARVAWPTRRISLFGC